MLGFRIALVCKQGTLNLSLKPFAKPHPNLYLITLIWSILLAIFPVIKRLDLPKVTLGRDLAG